jgi:hypothetical protein
LPFSIIKTNVTENNVAPSLTLFVAHQCQLNTVISSFSTMLTPEGLRLLLFYYPEISFVQKEN